MYNDDNREDEIKRLELIVQELKIRDDDESNRQKTADSKLLSALAALPIVIALSTSAFVPLLKPLAGLGCAALPLVALFFAALVLFLIASIKAIIGLWPMRAKYAAIGLRTFSSFAVKGSYVELLRTIIKERGDVVRNNKDVNSGKLGLYADAALYTVIGLIALTVLVFCLVVAFTIKPEIFAK